MNWRPILATIAVAWLAAACGKQATPVAPPPAAPVPAAPPGRIVPTHAQPKLRTLKLWMGAEEMTAEIAGTPQELDVGMMFRTNIEENGGMLFLLGPPLPLRHPAFWMKNVPLNLSAALMDPAGYILEFQEFKAESTNVVYAQATNVQYLLEASPGWFEKHHIAVGMLVRTDRGTFPDTFRYKSP